MSLSKNGSEAAPVFQAPSSLLELLESSVARYGERTLFLVKRDGRWFETSYAEFAKIVDAARGALAALGVTAGDRVGIIAGNGVEWAALAYASYGLRAAIVPMYESQRDADWEFLIRDAGVRVLFVSNTSISRRVARLSIPALEHVCVLDASSESAELRFRELLDRNQPAPVTRASADDVAALLYTSGTTGEPRGVVLTHGNILSNVLTVLELVPVSERHRTLSFLPWAHAFGHTLELHGVIAAGASMAIAESIPRIVDNLREVRPTVLIAVPRVFLRVHAQVRELLAQKPRAIRWLAQRGLALSRERSAGRGLSWNEHLVWWCADRLVFARVRARVGGRLEFAISGAASLPREVAELVDGLGIQVFEGYGLTETSPIVSANVPGQRKLGSVGRCLPGVRVVIDRGATGAERDGEIVVYGPNVMRGYHNRPEETRAVLASDGGLRTGDVGYFDADGFLYVTGRIKEQYKLANGKYVSPAALEERLKLSPFIADVMVYGDGRLHNVALVVPELSALRAFRKSSAVDDRTSAATEALLNDPRVKEKIASEIDAHSREFRGYERIRAFAVVAEGFTQENGLLTPSLKLKRRLIVERFREELERLYASEPRDRAFEPDSVSSD